MNSKPHYTCPDRSHAGASWEDIQNEPDWLRSHNNRIGFRDHSDRLLGYTHIGDEWNTEEDRQFLARAKEEAEELNRDLGGQNLVNFRELMTLQEVCQKAISVSDSNIH